MQTVRERLFERPGIIKKEIRWGIGLATFLILLAGAAYLYYHNPGNGLFIACPVYTFTGYYCPGCGAGRACFSVLHGHFHQAFRYNPMLIIMLPWLILYYFVCGIQWLKYGKEYLSVRIPEWIPLTIVVIFLLYGVIRNIEVYPFSLLAPTAI